MLLLLLVLPLQLLMMCGRQNQSGAPKDTRIVATNHVDPPPLSLPPPLATLLLSFTAFVCLLVRPFSCSYVNYCLSARCPLLLASSSFSFFYSTVTFHYTSVFFRLSHTHLHIVYACAFSYFIAHSPPSPLSAIIRLSLIVT